jgi:hypothetical protein
MTGNVRFKNVVVVGVTVMMILARKRFHPFMNGMNARLA